jgi:uncharacterized protein YukE
VPTPEPPLQVVDPEVDSLTFDQLSRLINEISPNVFYERALAFDSATARLEQVQDDLERETRNLWEAWQGKGADSFDDLVRQVSGLTAAVAQSMSSPGYGAAVRRAGDALAQAQQRIHELQAQNPRGDVPAARQILLDLGTAYQDIGTAIVPLPEGTGGLPAAGIGKLMPSSSPPGVLPPGGDTHLQVANQAGLLGGATGRRAGLPAVPFSAKAEVGAAHPAEGVTRGRSAVLAGVAQTEPGCPVPAVLGRVTQPVLGTIAGSGTRPVDFVTVLGRPSRVLTQQARPAESKQKKDASQHPATATEVRAKLGAPTESVALTSAGPAAQDKPAVMAQPALSAAEPAPVTAIVSTAPASTTQLAAAASHAPASGHAVSGHAPGPLAPLNVTAHAEVQSSPGSASTGGALSASPPLPPATGGLDAQTAPGMPPLATVGTGNSGPIGNSGVAGGVMGAMSRGTEGHGDSQNDRHPAGLLGAAPEVWDPAGGTPLVLGRRAPSPQSAEEDDRDLSAVEGLENIKDAEVRRWVLGRSGLKKES